MNATDIINRNNVKILVSRTHPMIFTNGFGCRKALFTVTPNPA
jgi:hypothetical protein